MTRKDLFFMAVLTVLALTLLAAPETGNAQTPSKAKFVMKDEAARIRETESIAVEGQVLRGSPAAQGDWPATFVFKTSEGACTATAVGRKVVLTAAHCLDDKEQIGEAIVEGEVKPVSLKCFRHERYPDDLSADFALCLLEKNLPALGNGFERINTDANLLRSKVSLWLLGYGCTTNKGKRDFGKLYHSETVIERQGDGPQSVVTFGGGALCSGDSGGGAFWLKSERQIRGRRTLVAINSRGDENTNSYLSVTVTDEFVGWARRWGNKQKATICGIHPAAEGCRLY